MTELLSQILNQIAPRNHDLAQLQEVFKQISGQTLKALLINKQNQMQLLTPLMQRTTSEVISLPINQSPSLGALSQILNDRTINAPIPVEVQFQIKYNRVSTQLEIILPANLSSLLKSEYNALRDLLSHYFQTPIPVSQFRLNTYNTALWMQQWTTVFGSLDHQKTLSIPMANALSPQNTSPLNTALTKSNPSTGITNESIQQEKYQFSQRLETIEQAVKLAIYHLRNNTGQGAQSAQSSNQSALSANHSLSNSNYLNQEPKLSSLLSKQLNLNSSDLIQKPIAELLRAIQSGTELLQKEFPEFKNNLIKKMLDEFLQQLPQSKQITSDSLKKAMLASGVFYESNLKSMKESLRTESILPDSTRPLLSNSNPQITDLKQLFLALKTLLSPSMLVNFNLTGIPGKESQNMILHAHPFIMLSKLLSKSKDATSDKQIKLRQQQILTNALNQLNQNVESGLSRTRLLQHLHVLNDTQQTPQWLFELPMQSQQEFTPVQFQLEKHPNSSSGSDKKEWTITIRFDLNKLGPFLAITRLSNQELSIKFVAEKHETQNLLTKEMPSLEKVLIDSGLMIKKTVVTQGKVPDLIHQKCDSSGIDLTV